MTLVVSETQQMLQRLNFDILSFLSAWVIGHRFKQEIFEPMLYQFDIAINAGETHFWPFSILSHEQRSRNQTKQL